MAKQVGTKIIGTYGNIIAYKWRSDYYYRTKGNTGKQAPAAREQASILGLASNLSARIRKSLPDTGSTNRKLMYRLNNALQQWLRSDAAKKKSSVSNIPSLEGFCFYGKPVNSFFEKPASIERKGGRLFLYLPAPGNNVSVSINAISCSLEKSDDKKVYETKLKADTGTPQKLELPLEERDGCLTVVILSVNRTSGIVGALYG